MKKRLIRLFLVLNFVFMAIIPAQKVDAKRVWVDSYTRKDGIRVRGHYRNINSSEGNATSNSAPEVKDYININNNTGEIFYKKCVNLYKYYEKIGTANASDLVYVKGYYDKNGNYVRPHFRTYPNQYIVDNFSYLGISTLKPLPISLRYNYTYNSNKDIQRIETYLLYNIENRATSIDSCKKSSIELYAKELENNTVTLDEAISFYKLMGFNDLVSTVISKYDIDGILTSDMYLYSILSNYGITIKEESEWLYNYYGALLNLYTKNEISYEKAKNFAYYFYNFMGLPANLIGEQIEMDLFQNFPQGESESYYEALLRNLLLIDLSYDWDNDRYNSNFESYMSILNGIKKYSDSDLYLSLYDMNLEFIKNMPYSNCLTNVYYWGYKLYLLLGYDNETSKQKIHQDVVLYLLN